MKLNPLIEYLDALSGHDVHTMPEVDASAFVASAFEKFSRLAAPIPLIALGEFVDDDFTWHMEPSDFHGDYIGSFKMVGTRAIESAIGRPEKVRMAAAIFPDATLEVALFGEFHYPGGLQSTPRLEVTVSTSGHHYLERMRIAICRESAALNALRQHPSIQRLRIVPAENACNEVVDPVNIGSGFNDVATSACEAALNNEAWGDDEITQRVDFMVDILPSGDGTSEAAEKIIHVFGDIFLGTVR